MARLVKDRIKQTTTTTGANNLALSGSVAGYQNFSVLGDGNTTFYCIEDANGTAFEVGIGTYTSNTLARTTILDSTNSGSAISLTSGTHDVFVTYPAGRAGFNDEGLSPTLTASGTITAGKPVIQNANGTVTQVVETPDAAISPGLGSAVAVTPAGSSGTYTASDSGVNGQRVIACRSDTTGSSNYNINLRVATVNTTDLKTVTYSGISTLTVGTAVTGIGIIYHEDAGKYVCTWRGDNGYLYGCALTVSGTGSTATVSAGTTLAIVSANIVGWASDCMCYDTVNDFVIITYEEYFARTSSLKITGTTLSVASAVSLASDIEVKGIPKCAWNKYHGIVVYIFQNQSEDLYYNLATPSTYGYIPVSGSNKALVDNVANWNDYTTCLSCDPDSGETVIIGADGDNKRSQGGNTIWGTSGTRSGFTITWGTFTQFSDVIFMANNAAGGSALKPIENGKMIYFMGTQTSSPTLPYRPVYTIVTTSGTSISYTTPASAGSQQSYGVTFLSLGINFSKTQALMSWGDTGSADAITSVTLLQTSQNGDGSSTNLTSTNYLGLASNSATTTNPVQINVNGSINNAQTSLTVDKDYYTTSAGSIVTRLNGSGVAQATQFVGTALSATALSLREFPASTIVGKADGTVTKGKPVIVEADGDFKQVVGSGGDVAAYNPDTQQVASSAYNDTDQFYVANNGSGTFCVVFKYSNGADVVIGVDNGTSITWGSEINISSGFVAQGATVYYDPDNDKFIASYVGNNNTVRSRIISYSGTTATALTESSTMSIDNATVSVMASAYDTTNNIGYVAMGKQLGRLFTVTVSGTTITQGPKSSQFSGSGNSAQFFNMVYDNTNNIGYITYRNEAISDYPYLQTYTVSGNTFTKGTETVIESTAAQNIVGVAEGSADGKGVVVAWKNNSGVIRYITPTFSGLTPTTGVVGSVSSVPSSSLYWEGPQVVNYNPTSQTFQISYQDTSSSKFNIITNSATVSSGTLTWGTYKIVYATTGTQYYVVNEPTGKNANNVYVIQSRASGSPYKIAGSLFGAAYNNATTNVTTENYIGIAQETVSTGNDVKVTTISGVDANQSNLTPAQIYYVQSDGTLSTTAGSPSVVAGTAIASTQLLVSRS